MVMILRVTDVVKESQDCCVLRSVSAILLTRVHMSVTCVCVCVCVCMCAYVYSKLCVDECVHSTVIV